MTTEADAASTGTGSVRAPASTFHGAVRALAFVGAGVIAMFVVEALLCDAPCDYGEGDTATWIWLLRHGHAIYGNAAAQGMTMVRTNYPPFQLWLVALLAPSDETILLVGRLLSLSGFLLTMAMVALSVSRATGSRIVALIAALFLAATFRAAFWAAICRADAIALGLGSVGVTLAALRVRMWPVLSAIAFATALLTKQNLVVFPIGTILWALTFGRERRAGLVLAATKAALVGALLAVFHLFDAIVSGSVASFRWINLARHLATSVAPSLLAIILALPLARGARPVPVAAQAVLGPWRGIFWVGLPWIVALGRTGADHNYLLELLTALAVLAPTAVAFGASRKLFIAQLSLAVVESTLWLGGGSTLIASRIADVKFARAQLEGVHGPIFAEQTYFAIAAGKAPVVIPFLAAQQAAQGLWQPGALIAAAHDGQLERVLLGFPLEEGAHGSFAWHDERFPPGLLDAIASRYELTAHTATLFIYSPRVGAGSKSVVR